MTLLFLFMAGIITSAISAIIGMGGGVLLLSALTLFIPYQVLIPLHGIAQLVSNSSRTFFLRKHVKKDIFLPFVLGAPIGFGIAFFAVKSISNPNYYLLILAIFILYTVFKPKKLPAIKLRTQGWFALGIASGLQGALIGATGPLLAPFFIRDDLEKEEIIATKALQQLSIHLFKIPFFLSLSFNYLAYTNEIVILSLAAILGTLIGVNVLKKVDHEIFVKMFKFVLILAAFRLIFKAIEDFTN